ncbi:LytTR family DNA-binding domain-containing protein [Eubacterium sp. 1001713B170207_170306_E7]|uniref:LytR/AlgR family response regulator transcription factor n=1 Tax=Eubacterium sp. 1001713B170207_170306_E7 TaxID=2787097 RepID=UPI00189A0BBE|nr:LytTR family DNA-binding domain-containing protein [Eubacterium sp. 1001713B170207_170306_E7]
MIKIAICDDQPSELADLAAIIKNYCKHKQELISLDCFQSSHALLDAVEDQNRFDILILDIILPDMDGIALAKALRAIDDESTIIFLTTSPDYALKSYEVNAFQYLLKPLDRKKLYDILDKLLERLTLTQTQRLAITTSHGIQSLKVYDITYVEHISHVLHIHTKNGATIATANSTITLTELENQINDSTCFLRPHRAFVVNLYAISTLNSDSFILEDGTVIPIAGRRYTEVKDQYLNFLLYNKGGLLL